MNNIPSPIPRLSHGKLSARVLTTLVIAMFTLLVSFAPLAAVQSDGAQRVNTPDGVPRGLSVADWSSIRRQYEQHRLAVFPVAGGYQAQNPLLHWLMRFDGRGFTTQPRSGGWQWGLKLRSYGFPSRMRTHASQPRVSVEGSRVAYDWDSTMQEWFVNDARGLEHGFTIHERPPGSGDRLLVNLTVRGSLRPEVAADGLGVRFVDAHGVTALTYAELVVRDSRGHTFSAQFHEVAGDLRLDIDERGAQYPLYIDPIAQQAYLKASNTGGPSSGDFYGDHFGGSVAVWGDTVAVAAEQEDSNATGVNGNESDNSAIGSGAVYVFVRSGATWSQQAYLKASNTEAGDRFGTSISLSRNTLVVGAVGEDSNATGVNGNQSDNTAADKGAAYVFVRNGTTWSQQAYLKPSNDGYSFGGSVSVSVNTIVVGATSEDSNATGVNGNQGNTGANNSGAAYVFVRNGTTWSQQAYLKASNTEANDTFGWSVAVSDNTVAVGAVGEASNATGVNGNQSDNSAASSGAVYVFARSGTTWSQQAYLKASNTDAQDHFGFSVAVAGSTVVVGAYFESSNGSQGDNSLLHSGAAYVFVRSGTIWSQQAYLKASNPGVNDWFGYSVSVSGNIVVVGAYGESSNATGINGNQSDNSSIDSGAAYVFVRSGTTWSQQAYVKASNTDAGDAFGLSVAVSGSTAVIGAPYEDSNATGVNGNQSDNSLTDPGAAYILTGLGSGVVIGGTLTNTTATNICCPRISFDGPAGADYHIERALSLTGPWLTVVSNTVPEDGIGEFTDTAAPPIRAFYRVAQP